MLNEIYKSALQFRLKHEGVYNFDLSIFILFLSLLLNIMLSSFYFSSHIEKNTITVLIFTLFSCTFIISLFNIMQFLYLKKKAFKKILNNLHLNEECSICLTELTEVILSSKNYNSQIYIYIFNLFKMNSKFSGLSLSIKEIFFSRYALEYFIFLDNLIQKAEEHQKIIHQPINSALAI